jgi:hypothetical protein
MFLQLFTFAFIQLSIQDINFPMGGPTDYTLLSNFSGNSSIPTGANAGSTNSTGNFSLPTGTNTGSNIQPNPSVMNAIPLGARQIYDHRNLHCVESLNYYNPKD